MIDFVDVGDTAGLINAISRILEDEDHFARRQRDVEAFAGAARNPFVFYFMRFLLALGEINFDQFYAVAGSHFDFGSDRICLGLPEYRKRQETFEEANCFGFEMFPGLRHSMGWVGCGLSYKFIMRKAQEQGFERITVCEDDVEFLHGWQHRFDAILDRLDATDDWDIFAGLIADLHPDTKVTGVVDCASGKLAHVSKMVSMVLNVYSRRSFGCLSRWNPGILDPATNTIDRFIEAHGGLRFVTSHPFLVGHREELTSTLWNFQNTQYNSLIEKSSAELLSKMTAAENEAEQLLPAATAREQVLSRPAGHPGDRAFQGSIEGEWKRIA